jgi:hypothetical protein
MEIVYMSLDLIGLLLLTGVSAVAIIVPAIWYVRGRGGVALVTAHILWFAIVVTLAGVGVLSWGLEFGAPVVALSIAVPIIVIVVLATQVPASRRALSAIPVPALIAVHGIRILGFLFLLLFATGRLSAPFAPSAGWGDVLAGSTAVPVAWALASRVRGARGLVLVWNSVGLLDLVDAAFLGMTSAPGSPLQMFFDPPGSAAMATLPWALIPVFLVPQLIVSHLPCIDAWVGSRLISDGRGRRRRSSARPECASGADGVTDNDGL